MAEEPDVKQVEKVDSAIEDSNTPRESRPEDNNRPPQSFGIGSSINWDSPLEPIAMAVELPFWLLIPNSDYVVEAAGARVSVVVDGTGIELQRGKQFTRTHATTVFMGSEEAYHRATVPAAGLPAGGLFRGTRTLLYVEAFAVSDALEAFFGPDVPRFQDGSRYMASLAVGQLGVVNALINGYRRAAVDPFASEVAAWDVPTWFVQHRERSRPICCYPHLVQDWYPTRSESFGSSKSYPLFATTPEAVAKQLSLKELPGEVELLNGWSRFYRGAYGDSIRSFVTAVEVLLEAEMRRLLAAVGTTEDEIENRLRETRSRFNLRLEAYCQLTKRRVPGPILHDVPYVNGSRFLYEFGQTRELRHDIVHGGFRLDHKYAGLMLRAAETTTWLFDWLSNGGDFEARRRVNLTLFSILRSDRGMFHCEVRDGKIVVTKPPYVSEDKVPDDLLLGSIVYSESYLLARIAPPNAQDRDVEHFTKMAFYEMGLGELEDSPYADKDGPIVERFRINWNGKAIGVYLLDVSEKFGRQHLDELDQSLPDEGEQANRSVRAVLIVNDQMTQPTLQRKALDAQLDAHAKSRGISVLATPGLARLLISAIRNRWARRPIAEAILELSELKAVPPMSRLLGEVIQFWPRIGVVGIRPLQGAVAVTGDIVAIEHGRKYEQLELGEVRIEDAGLMSVKLAPEVTKLSVGGKVFVLDKDRSFEPPEEPTTDFKFPPGTAIAAGYVHPSRNG
jgi:hypothetical protein